MMVLQIVENLTWHSSFMWTGGENVTISLCFQLQTNPCNPGTSVGRQGGGSQTTLDVGVPFLDFNRLVLVAVRKNT